MFYFECVLHIYKILKQLKKIKYDFFLNEIHLNKKKKWYCLQDKYNTVIQFSDEFVHYIIKKKILNIVSIA